MRGVPTKLIRLRFKSCLALPIIRHCQKGPMSATTWEGLVSVKTFRHNLCPVTNSQSACMRTLRQIVSTRGHTFAPSRKSTKIVSHITLGTQVQTVEICKYCCSITSLAYIHDLMLSLAMHTNCHAEAECSPSLVKH